MVFSSWYPHFPMPFPIFLHGVGTADVSPSFFTMVFAAVKYYSMSFLYLPRLSCFLFFWVLSYTPCVFLPLSHPWFTWVKAFSHLSPVISKSYMEEVKQRHVKAMKGQSLEGPGLEERAWRLILHRAGSSLAEALRFLFKGESWKVRFDSFTWEEEVKV